MVSSIVSVMHQHGAEVKLCRQISAVNNKQRNAAHTLCSCSSGQSIIRSASAFFASISLSNPDSNSETGKAAFGDTAYL